jgi:hypothetical protein
MKSLAAIASGQGCMSGLLLLFLIFGGISKAAEAATFNYTGPAFSIPECAGQFTPSSICIGGNIAVSVTIPDSVVASGQANANQITSWSISAAGVTLSSSGGNYLLANSTGFVFSNGLPATWEFAAATNNATFVELISEGGDEITTNWTGAAGEDEFLAGSTNGTYTYSAVGIVYTTQPGTWTRGGGSGRLQLQCHAGIASSGPSDHRRHRQYVRAGHGLHDSRAKPAKLHALLQQPCQH